MLALNFGNCEKCGGNLGPMATKQSTQVTCKKCDHCFEACEKCKSDGCPKCGGKLLDAGEHIKHTTDRDVMF